MAFGKSCSPTEMRRSIDAWTTVLGAWGITTRPAVLSTVLQSQCGTRSTDPPHAWMIGNHEDVERAFETRAELAEFRWMWRSQQSTTAAPPFDVAHTATHVAAPPILDLLH